ncbi:MAG: hypothetical protein II150_10890, partial [Thermoguttaceae bacterium]|nr:hypothetical protein [Thermoguttaceae bacterium]
MTQNEQIETTQDFVEFDASFSQDWLQAVKSDAAPPPLLPQTVADIPKCAFRTSKKARPKISRAFKKIGRGGAILLLGVAIGVATDRTLVVRMNVESSRLANTAASNASGETTIAPDFDNDNLTRFESFDGLNVSNDLTNILDSRDSIYSDLDVDCLDNVDGLAAYAQNDAYDLEVHDENSGDATRVENPFLNFGAAPYADLRQDTVENGANTDAFPTFNDGPTAIADLPNEDARNFPTWADLANPTNVESAPNENAFGAPYGAAPTQSAFAAPQGVYAAQYAPSQSQAPSQSVVESAKPRAQGFEGFQSYVARSTAPADMTATTPQGNNVNAN